MGPKVNPLGLRLVVNRTWDSRWIADEGYAEMVIAEFNREGVNDEALAAGLQRDGAAAFAKSWNDLMYRIAAKSEALAQAK